MAFFVSHRLPIADEAIRRGFDVRLLVGQPGSPIMEASAMEEILNSRVAVRRFPFRSSSINPIRELWALLSLTKYLFKERPIIVHCVSPKGVLYGGIAARIAGVKGVVMAVSGMGYIATKTVGRDPVRLIIGFIYKRLARFAFGHKNLAVIVQNSDDALFVRRSLKVDQARINLIPGSGVDLSKYKDFDIYKKKPIVLLPARMLKDKGVIEFVESARTLKSQYPSWDFLLAGAADYENPSSISRETIENWESEGMVEWLGHVEDIVPVLGSASIVCLPSYREGMPKSLLEAAAAGCAIVTTDSVGCREAIIPGETGELVPTENVELLTKAIRKLIDNKALRERYGENGRKLAADRYDLKNVVSRTLDIYNELISVE